MAKTQEKSQSLFKGVYSQSEKGEHYLSVGITPVGTVLYPACFKPTLTYDGRVKSTSGKETTVADRQYQVTLLFEKSDACLKDMQKAISQLAATANGGKKDISFRSPIKDGNEMFEKDEDKYAVYKNKLYISLSRPAKLDPPTVLDEQGQAMMSETEMYSGCLAVAKVDFKWYSTFGGGVTAYWSAIKKVADGEKITPDRSERIAHDLDNSTSGIKIVNGKAVYN